MKERGPQTRTPTVGDDIHTDIHPTSAASVFRWNAQLSSSGTQATWQMDAHTRMLRHTRTGEGKTLHRTINRVRYMFQVKPLVIPSHDNKSNMRDITNDPYCLAPHARTPTHCRPRLFDFDPRAPQTNAVQANKYPRTRPLYHGPQTADDTP